MRLKYYLRGAGIGIFVTTILFMILISMHKNDGVQGSGASLQAENTESKTVAQTMEDKDTQEAAAETESRGQAPSEEPKTGDKAAAPDAKQEDKPLAPDTKTEGEPAASDVKQGEKPDAPDAKPENQKQEQKPDGQDTPEKPAQPEEKVRVEISGGQYSDVVCKKLEEAGVVDSAKAFNDYLVQKGYDNGILPGVYEIPKGATYDEIAVLLTTKVR